MAPAVHESNLHKYAIIPPKCSAGECTDTPEDLPKLPVGCGIACGKSGTGKTTAVVTFIECMDFDRVFWVGHTIKSNKPLLDRLGKRLAKEDIFEDLDDETIIDEIRKRVEQEAKDLEQFEKELARYNAMMKLINSPNMLFEPSPEELVFFNGVDFLAPSWRYGLVNGKPRKPKLTCVVDDALGSTLFSRPRKLNALSTFSRHLGSFEDGRPAIGLNLFFLVQSLKAQVGGLTKVIRNQTKLWLIWKTHSKKELEDLREAVAGEVPARVFDQVIKQAHREPHDFLMIDLQWKRGVHASPFRRNFCTFLVPPRNTGGDVLSKKREVVPPVSNNPDAQAVPK